MKLIDADELKTAFPCGESIRTESVRATIDALKAQCWIPCSERLPEEGEYYLVTRQYFGWNCTEYREIDIAKCDFNEWNKANVIAWCELPEPYKGENDE